MIRRPLILAVFLLIVMGGATYAYMNTRPKDAPLTGLSAPADIANRRAVAIMLDNIAPDARPQSGLNRADLVFETLAEGGITRFMAVFQSHDAPSVGPVRSTRLYFNPWADGLHVIFGHDGGNVDALQQLPSLSGICNIDADKSPAPYHRTSDRAVPHNEYTSTAALWTYAGQHGCNTSNPPPAFVHKAEAPPSARPAHFSLHVAFSGPEYAVDWRYDPATNTYLRFMGGTPHVEATTGKQLSAKNIVVMVTDETSATDPFTPGAIHLRTQGTGSATVYRDGQVITGTWSKASVGAPLRWLDGAGNQIPLDRGVTWVEVVPAGTSVTAGS